MHSYNQFLLCFCLLGLPISVHAQVPGKLSKEEPIRLIDVPNRPTEFQRPGSVLPCDLQINTNPALETVGTSRKLRVVVRNFGEGSARACQLTVRYDWRIDHESASATRLEETYSIDAVRPSGQWVMLVTIPDERLRSNRSFGSDQALVTLTADATQATTDVNRSNNRQTTQVPIINRR